MPVEIVIEDKRWADVAFKQLCDRAVAAALRTFDLDPSLFTVEILACDDTRIALLSRDFRGQAKPDQCFKLAVSRASGFKRW